MTNMTEQKFKQLKPREELLTIQVKNTTLHLSGPNLRLAAKTGGHSKTPGFHLSAMRGREAVGQFTASSQTKETTAQLGLFPHKSPRPDVQREYDSHPVRTPLKLPPLEPPDKHRQKLKCIQQDAKLGSYKLNVTVNDACTRKVKSCVRQRPEKAAASPAAPSESVKGQHQPRTSRPQLTRFHPIEKSDGRNLENVVCQGTPAPLCCKPAPPVNTPRVRAPCGREAARLNPGAHQQDAGRRRVRLRRAQCLDEDQCNSNTSGGLSADEGKLAQGVQSKGHGADGAPGGQSHAGRGINHLTAISRGYGGVSKTHCNERNAECKAESAGSDTMDGVKPHASTWRFKRRNQ